MLCMYVCVQNEDTVAELKQTVEEMKAVDADIAAQRSNHMRSAAAFREQMSSKFKNITTSVRNDVIQNSTTAFRDAMTSLVQVINLQ